MTLRFGKVSWFLLGAALIFAVSASRSSALPTDLDNFLACYPDKMTTRLNSCLVCHKESPPAGPDFTRNLYGDAYAAAGRTCAALVAIQSADADKDGFSNIQEILFNSFPGNPTDVPTLPPGTATPTPTSAGTPTVTPTVTETLPPLPTPTTVGSGSCAVVQTGADSLGWWSGAWLLPALWLRQRRRRLGATHA